MVPPTESANLRRRLRQREARELRFASQIGVTGHSTNPTRSGRAAAAPPISIPAASTVPFPIPISWSRSAAATPPAFLLRPACARPAFIGRINDPGSRECGRRFPSPARVLFARQLVYAAKGVKATRPSPAS
ncbi:hypothetical protein EVAR_8862_1 [Eumeta japonica]|uniref:Uncharacterized protein n=1 Tax=Eumeta variegata TaxID=151549 RepID=A0A4C1TUQ7_EUMVA|nr:hypothetical protein EVAR_8862_1 [Eumeta japonica]